MSNDIITVRDYLRKGLPFLVPNYQRGYIWGKSRGNEKDSVSFLMESILYNSSQNNTELFLQGITVCEHDNIIELIDGQQRTTFLYLLLNYLGSNTKFELQYPIREKSENFLKSIIEKSSCDILSMCAENENEQFQDIYYFKKTIRIIDNLIIRIIDNSITGKKKSELVNFILDKVKFLYISIPKEKAITVFSMMNGNKALMKYEEIIKAEMLRLVSNETEVNETEVIEESEQQKEAIRWEQNLLRSKYAREWDRWLYWWNRSEVKTFYHTDNVMGLLIETYYYSKNQDKNRKFNFENFRDKLLRSENDELSAKNTFYDLRHLQKRFEDSYNNVATHNRLGTILIMLNNDDRKNFIRTYFANHENIDIKEYLKYALLFVSNAKIMDKLKGEKYSEDEKDPIEDAKSNLKEAINNDLLYQNKEYYELASAQLLRLNMEQDIKLGRFFNFEIWKERSLEHIYPKSKVYHQNENRDLVDGNENSLQQSVIDDSYLNRGDFKNNGSEHCIGNLVLLYKNDNSKFSNSSFNEKKSIYFNLEEYKNFQSRLLLHTISVFAKDKWGVEEIKDNKKSIIKEIKKYYEIQ